MSPEQIALVEVTLQEVRPRLDDVAVQFYERLAAASPDVATLFSGGPAAQRRKFITELDAICLAIRNHAAFLARARRLGRLHRDLGVRSRHYVVAEPALLGALAEALGASWSPEVAQAWRLAYRLTAETMMAADAVPPAP
jgi:hemoglobin-like flavoprotein